MIIIFNEFQYTSNSLLCALANLHAPTMLEGRVDPIVTQTQHTKLPHHFIIHSTAGNKIQTYILYKLKIL